MLSPDGDMIVQVFAIRKLYVKNQKHLYKITAQLEFFVYLPLKNNRLQ